MSLNGSGTFSVDVDGVPIPPGVHPGDATALVRPGWDSNQPVTQDQPGNKYNTGSAPWSTDNDKAVPVYQRQDHDWTTGHLTLTQTGAVVTIVSRQAGRGPITLAVPATMDGVAVVGGLVVGPDQGDVANGGGWTLNIGDSMTIPSEASVYARLPSGASSGSIQWFATLNPAGGGLGAQ